MLSNIARVQLEPMKTPSNTKETTPARGMATAQPA